MCASARASCVHGSYKALADAMRLAHVLLLVAAAQVLAHQGSPLPGAEEGVAVRSSLSGRPKGVGVSFEQRRPA